MGKDKSNYYAIITAEVRYDNNLTDSEKLLYAEITALSNQKGYCWSSNKYFADLYDVTKGTISKRISKLVDEGYLKRELIRNDDNEVVERKLYPLNNIGYAINKQEGMVNKNQVNTTRTNTTSNNNMSSQKDDDIEEVWQQYKSIFADYYKPRVFSKKRKGHIRQRLKTYSVDELVKAMKAIKTNDYMLGKNENNRFYAKPEYCFKNDEKVEEWLNKYEGSGISDSDDVDIDYYADLRE